MNRGRGGRGGQSTRGGRICPPPNFSATYDVKKLLGDAYANIQAVLTALVVAAPTSDPNYGFGHHPSKRRIGERIVNHSVPVDNDDDDDDESDK